MIHTNTNVSHQMEVSVDYIEYASPQNQTDNEEMLTVDDNNAMIKWEPVYDGKPNNMYVINELIAINILTKRLIP